MPVIFDKRVKVVKAPDAQKNVLYKLTKAIVKMAKIKNSLVGTKEEVLAKAAKMNAKGRYFVMPKDKKANYTDHMILGKYHCLEVDIENIRRQNAVMLVFGGGMILGSDKGDVGLSRKIAQETFSDVWFPYYPMCHEHDMLENVQMIFECYIEVKYQLNEGYKWRLTYTNIQRLNWSGCSEAGSENTDCVAISLKGKLLRKAASV